MATARDVFGFIGRNSKRIAAAVVGAAVVGGVPEAVLYAVAGELAVSYAGAAVIFVAVIALAAGTWVMAARRPRTSP